MFHRRQFFLLIVFAAFCIVPAAGYAQDNPTCPAIVETALEAVDRLCTDTERNEACYGNFLLTATARPDVADFAFDQPGDITELVKIESMQLNNMDLINQTWGVAMMKIQANLPDTLPGQNVTLLLFGDVEITNAVDPDDTEQKPMQAFYFNSGIGDRRCLAAPDSGIL